MTSTDLVQLKKQLSERRVKLESAISDSASNNKLISLLHQVDSALERIDAGVYGICDVCGDAIEEDRLATDPLITVCLDHLSEIQQRSLENDIDLAARIQNALLPHNDILLNGFDVSYHYLPAGAVSGDYCDIIAADNSESFLFLLGDITGKGIAASMLMTHVHALFHSLASLNLPLGELMERANRLFCESSLYTHFLTLVCGRAYEGGRIELCNAGHCLPIIIRKDSVVSFESTGLPLGIFCTGGYIINSFSLDRGESILIYSDGLSEAFSGEEEYGVERINSIADSLRGLGSSEIVKEVKKDLHHYMKGQRVQDDLAIMAINRKA